MTVTDYLSARASAQKIPISGTFELSPVCNFSCKMCYIRQTPAQVKAAGKEIIDWNQWLALGEQCRDAGMLYLLLTGGEPFLYPHFRELYEALHRMGIILSINTNGTLIDEQTVEWLKTMAPARVNITLYGSSRETYQRLCGDGSGYDRATKAIRMLKEAGIPVVINASMTPLNVGDLEDIFAFGKELGLNTRMATYMFPPARRPGEPTDIRFTPEESAAAALRKFRCSMGPGFCNWAEKELSKVGKPEESGDSWGSGDCDETMRCRAGRSSFWVSWDGTMTACGMMPFPMEVYPFREDFRDSWLRLTDAVRTTPVMQGCAGCEKKGACHPCAAIVYTETGDVNGKPDYLCRLSDHLIENLRRGVQEEKDHEKLDE